MHLEKDTPIWLSRNNLVNLFSVDEFQKKIQSNRIYPSIFNATWTLNTPRGILYGEAAGEALKQGDYWRLRGRSRVAVGPLNSLEATGGFIADLYVGSLGSGDDSISWRLDAVPKYGQR